MAKAKQQCEENLQIEVCRRQLWEAISEEHNAA